MVSVFLPSRANTEGPLAQVHIPVKLSVRTGFFVVSAPVVRQRVSDGSSDSARNIGEPHKWWPPRRCAACPSPYRHVRELLGVELVCRQVRLCPLRLVPLSFPVKQPRALCQGSRCNDEVAMTSSNTCWSSNAGLGATFLRGLGEPLVLLEVGGAGKKTPVYTQCQGYVRHKLQHPCDCVSEATVSDQPSVCATREIFSSGRDALRVWRLGSFTTFLASSTEVTWEESNSFLHTR